jgi:hypothetical protein
MGLLRLWLVPDIFHINDLVHADEPLKMFGVEKLLVGTMEPNIPLTSQTLNM